MKRGIAVALAAALVIAGLVWIHQRNRGVPAAETRPMVGYLAPDFALSDLDGNTVRLSDLRGKVVFINFWTTWCPACREEMPNIQQIHEEMGDDVKILAVDIGETRQTVTEFMQYYSYSFPVILDSTGATAEAYRVSSIPASFFIDRSGVIREKYVGPMSVEMMRSFIAKASRG